MDLRLTDSVALVTGGAQGIGAAIARAFAAEGAVAVVVDRDEVAGREFVAAIEADGGRARFVAAELTDEAACRAAVADATAASGGRLDVLVHNAGFNDCVGLDAAPDAFMTSLRRNLFHVFALTHFALPALRASAHGAIVMIGSKVSLTGQGGTAGYAAAKGGMNALTREWAAELAADGIRVNCVVPAEVATSQYESWLARRPNPVAERAAIEAQIPLGRRLSTPVEIADVVVFTASPRSAHTTGQILVPDGGYTHLDRALTNRRPDERS